MLNDSPKSQGAGQAPMVCVQTVSRLSKMTKLSFVNEKLNWTSYMRAKQSSKRNVPNGGRRCPKSSCCSVVRAGRRFETPLAQREHYTGTVLHRRCPECQEREMSEDRSQNGYQKIRRLQQVLCSTGLQYLGVAVSQ